MRQIPQDEAEFGVLASMMLAPHEIPAIQQSITSEDFGNVAYHSAFDLFVSMKDAGESLRDGRLVITRLRQAGLFEALGGNKLGNQQFLSVAAADNVSAYVASVVHHSITRQVNGLATNLAAKQHDDCRKTIGWLRSELERIESRASTGSHISTMGEACDSVVSDVRESMRGGATTTVPTGLKQFDGLYGGLAASRLYVIAARPGNGKSALSQQIGEFIAGQEIAAHFVSLEMSAKEVAVRYLARQTGLNGKHIASAALQESELWKLADASADAHRLPFSISVPIGRKATIESICAEARMMYATARIGVLIVDYAQIVEETQRGQMEVEKITRATRALKGIARELQIPVVVLSQLNRKLEDTGSSKNGTATPARAPRLSDLKGSGSIEQDADGVLLLHEVEQGLIEINVPKMRGGERTSFQMRFHGPTCTFSETSVEDADNYVDEFTEFR